MAPTSRRKTPITVKLAVLGNPGALRRAQREKP